ncbi:MAG: hypothetical protein R3D59_07570 [Paracoccaceae bacterium]
MRLSLPRLTRAGPDRTEASGAPLWRRVLVVEDGQVDLAAHRRALQTRAGEIVTATSLDAGLARLDEGRFDLVVTDLSLDGRPDGWHMPRPRWTAARRQAVAVVSGRLPERHPFGDRFGDALVTLSKPLDTDILTARLEGALKDERPALGRGDLRRRWHIGAERVAAFRRVQRRRAPAGGRNARVWYDSARASTAPA